MIVAVATIISIHVVHNGTTCIGKDASKLTTLIPKESAIYIFIITIIKEDEYFPQDHLRNAGPLNLELLENTEATFLGLTNGRIVRVYVVVSTLTCI